MTFEPAPIAPETKDWTFVLSAGCRECGYSPDIDPGDLGNRFRATIPRWRAALGSGRARQRPKPEVWSALEYGCHVRDVARIMLGRLELMLSADDAHFENWDQDATAVADRYWDQDPRVVADEYAAAATKLAARYDSVTQGQWERRGVRSDGSKFTVASFGVYALHDLEHHLYDVGA